MDGNREWNKQELQSVLSLRARHLQEEAATARAHKENLRRASTEVGTTQKTCSSRLYLFFFLIIYFSVWLCYALVAACRIFRCGVQTLN